MISFTSIITAIKGASLAAKVGLGVGAVVVVAGGTAGTVAIINANQPHEETQIVANNPDDDNSPSERKDTQIGETGEPEDDNNKTKQTGEDNKPTANNSQTTTQKPNNSPASNNQSNNSSSSKPSTPTAQPSQPSQPSQPTQPTKKPDYNLNDNYVMAFCMVAISGNTVNFQAVGKSAEVATNACVAKAISNARTYSEYANMSDSDIMSEILGGGYAGQLTEVLCSQYGLSCGRW